MEIEKDQYNNMIVYASHGCIKPLVIPVSEISSDNDLIVAITEYFDKLPEPIVSKIFFFTALETDAVEMTLEKTCHVVFELTKLIQTDKALKGTTRNIVTSVIYDEDVLNFIIGKLNFSIGPDTLISKQVGNA